MKKTFTKILLAIIIANSFLGIVPVGKINAYDNIKATSSFNISPNYANEYSTWTLVIKNNNSYQFGHLLGSLGGWKPDFSGATISISGLPSGYTTQVGRTNANCASGCDDLRIIYPNQPVTIPAGQEIVITLSNVKNPAIGATKAGWNYISIFNEYPIQQLSADVGGLEYPLVNKPTPQPEPTPEPAPVPTPTPTPTPAPAPKPTPSPIIIIDITIIDIEINQWFFFEGSRTTDLSKIENPASVSNFTLDRQDLTMMTFLGDIDMSTDTAENAVKGLDNNVGFEYMLFWMSWEFWAIWEAPVEVTFYDTENQYTEDSAVTLNGNVLSAEDYQVTKTENGEKKVTLSPEVIKENEGEKIEVKLEPTLKTNLDAFQDYVDLETGILTIEGTVSDTKSEVFIVLNDEEVKVEYDENGNFTKEIQLIEGRNTVTAYAKNEELEFGRVEGAITYTAPVITESDLVQQIREFFSNNWVYIIIGIVLVLGGGIVVILGIFSLLLKKNLFLAPFKVIGRMLKKK